MYAAAAHGIALSLGLIVALGPQNVFVFQQGAAQPRLRDAAPTVVAAGVSDTLLVVAGVLGLSLVVLRLPWVRTALLAAGVVMLAYVGYALVASPVLSADPDTESRLDPRGQVGFAASVSLLNPHAVLDTVGVIGTSALAYAGGARWAFAAGALVVSWCWFAGLATAGRLVGASERAGALLRPLNAASAVVVWLVAAYMAWRLLGLLGVV